MCIVFSYFYEKSAEKVSSPAKPCVLLSTSKVGRYRPYLTFNGLPYLPTLPPESGKLCYEKLFILVSRRVQLSGFALISVLLNHASKFVPHFHERQKNNNKAESDTIIKATNYKLWESGDVDSPKQKRNDFYPS